MIYKVTKQLLDKEKYGLINQLRRVSISISSNLSEGTSRITNKDKAHFTTMSFSSAMEILNQLIISKELEFITEKDYLELRQQLSKITNKHINVLTEKCIN